jgi:hypothetical protein
MPNRLVHFVPDIFKNTKCPGCPGRGVMRSGCGAKSSLGVCEDGLATENQNVRAKVYRTI